MGYSIRCGCHTYITLEYDGKVIFCLDNDIMKAEEMIWTIEKRTCCSITDIKIDGDPSDFEGLSFFTGGWKRKFWAEMPSKAEIKAYMDLKRGWA